VSLPDLSHKDDRRQNRLRRNRLLAHDTVSEHRRQRSIRPGSMRGRDRRLDGCFDQAISAQQQGRAVS